MPRVIRDTSSRSSTRRISRIELPLCSHACSLLCFLVSALPFPDLQTVANGCEGIAQLMREHREEFVFLLIR